MFVRQLFGLNLRFLRGKKTQNEAFELLNIECWNSQYRKMFVRQLFGQNLGALWGEANHQIKLLNCST